MEWTPRMSWDEVPVRVRSAVEQRLGGAAVSVEPVVGGFSAGFAGIVRAGARSAFVKATSATINDHGRSLYRRELDVCEVLHRHGTDVGLQWGFDLDDWTVLGFDVVTGRIYDAAWDRESDLREVLTTLEQRRAEAPEELPALDVVLDDLFAAWSALSADPSFVDWPTDADGHRLREPQQWCALADRARRAFAGSQLLHADLRGDNILRTASGPVLVDWAYACRGDAAFDPVYLLLEVARMRGVEPVAALDQVVERYGCDPDDVTALLATFDGWFTWMSRQPPVPALPELRAFQTEMAAAARSWVRSRLAVPTDTDLPGSRRPAASAPVHRGSRADA